MTVRRTGLGKLACSVVFCLALTACPSGKTARPSPSLTSLTSKTPVEIFNAALDVARAAGSLRAITSFGDGTGDTYDIGTSSGRVVIQEDPDVMEVRVVGGVAYAKGNRDAMIDILGASKSIAGKYANHWIQFSRDDDNYMGLTDSVTMPSFIDDLGFTGAIEKFAPSTINGKKVIGLEGPLFIGGRGTLYVSLEGDPVPVEQTSPDPKGQLTVDFDRWGQTIDVRAPAGAIGASTIGL
jgi:hypothetical protein